MHILKGVLIYFFPLTKWANISGNFFYPKKHKIMHDRILKEFLKHEDYACPQNLDNTLFPLVILVNDSNGATDHWSETFSLSIVRN